MRKHQRITALAVVGAMSAASAAIGVTAAGAAGTPRAVNVTKACSKGSMGNLQVQREDNGKLSVDLGVDMARHAAGVPWRISASDNGRSIASATVRTISDGSFSVTRVLSPLAGANHVVFYAKNLKTGETCQLNGIA